MNDTGNVVDEAVAAPTSRRRLLNPWATAAVFATLAVAGHRSAYLACVKPFVTMQVNTAATDSGNEDVSVSSSLAAMVGLNGNVSECSCSFTEIEETNIATVRPLLKKIVRTPFFSHFKIDLCSNCELWEDQPLCVLRDCGVCECDEPPVWASEVDGMPPTGPDCKHVEDDVVTTVDSRVTRGWQSIPTSFLDEPLGAATNDVGDGLNKNEVVVDLRLNPEHYTGYSGPSAAKVWSAIHSTNCFQPSASASASASAPASAHQKKLHEEDYKQQTNDSKEWQDPMYCLLPAEQRLYNRLISGLHSSISLHIAQTYCVEIDRARMGECKRWGTQNEIAHERVLHHSDRVENLYVAFALLLRAVVKAGPAVTAAVPQDDPFFAESLSEWTDSLLPELIDMAHSCPNTFDESDLLVDPGLGSKKVELQRRFQHLQEIMQCVGCDRCKLWGTLQTLGIGTALRVLFHDSNDAGSKDEVQLTRQEAVALVHTLERFSSSLVFAHDLRRDR